jgi:hypothetical protein
MKRAPVRIAFRGAGVPPAVLGFLQVYKIAGETPAPRKPFFRPELGKVHSTGLTSKK